MADGTEGTLKDRLTRQGEDALGRFAQDLLENPLVNAAIARAFEARERATQAQDAALGVLNLPSAGDVERITRRLRSVSQRLEGIEDAVDRLDGRLQELVRGPDPALGDRLAGVESQLAKLSSELTAMGGALGHTPAPVPREQERLDVQEVAPPAPSPPKPRRARRPPAAKPAATGPRSTGAPRTPSET
jgi:hypothetical protein